MLTLARPPSSIPEPASQLQRPPPPLRSGDLNGLTNELHFGTVIRLDHTPQHAPDFRIDEAALNYPFSYDPDEAAALAQTMQRHHADDGDEVCKWARQFVSAELY